MLQKKYNRFEDFPESFNGYDFYRSFFKQNYSNTGKRWKHFWEEKMDEEYENVRNISCH
jgi:hypothetical protein